MNNIKSRTITLLALTALALAACGGGEGGTENSAPSSGAPAQPAPVPPPAVPANTAPVISGSPATNGTAGTTYLFQPSASDRDGDLLVFSASGLPAWASINIHTGLVSGTPAESHVGTTANIVVSVSDGAASASLPAFVITIASSAPPPVEPPPVVMPPSPPANNAPSIAGMPSGTVQAMLPYVFVPSATDPESQPLSFSIVNKPSWASFSAATGALSGTPTASDVRTFSNIVISVTDGQLSASLPAFSITVTSPPNRAPSVGGTPPTTATAKSAYSFTPNGSDPDGQTLSWSISNKPAWAAFNPSTGMLSGTPATTDVRTFSNIVITASDGSLSASLPAFSITVSAPPNTAPVVGGTPAASVTANTAYSFTPTGSDADGQTLSWSISNKPSWASFNSTTGKLSGTPTSANVGTFSGITISASDGTDSTSLAPFSITVNAAPNTAPTISGTPSGSVVAGTAYSFTPAASDADGDTLGFSISGKPSWATFNVATGALTGTPTTAQVGTYVNIVISVSDGKTSKALPGFSISVTQPPATGTAALSWAAPTQNTDGSTISGLAGYRVYHGLSASALNDVVVLPGASSTSYTYSQLGSGTHYFAVTAYNITGVESALSAVGSKTIP